MQAKILHGSIFLWKSFWLSNEENLISFYGHEIEREIGMVQSRTQNNLEFYKFAIERLKNCADVRQVANAWLNYYRFICKKLRADPGGGKRYQLG